MPLEHIPSELHDRHPATGRDVYGTNDLDVALRNPIRPDYPSGVGVGHMVTCHGLLNKEEPYSVATPPSRMLLTHTEKLINRSTDVLQEPGKCDWFSRMCLVSRGDLTLPIPISRPL